MATIRKYAVCPLREVLKLSFNNRQLLPSVGTKIAFGNWRWFASRRSLATAFIAFHAASRRP
jgi:hypothetical protein